MSAPARILLLGATGVVGARTLAQALDDPRVAHIVAPVRRAPRAHPKLVAPVVDFSDLDSWPQDVWSVDAAISCLGTTIKTAGSRRRFAAVDHDLPVEIARRVRAAGANGFALVSAMGADPSSRVFYSRVKGEAERDVIALGFPSTVILRPGLLDADRAESRPGERAAIVIFRALAPIMPRAWRASSVAKIATALIEAATTRPPGVRIIPSPNFA